MGLPSLVEQTQESAKQNPQSSIENSRRLESWIDGFVRLTEGTGSPLIFRKWSALSIVAGALERKIWVRTTKQALYPNLYVLLVGGPGIGKTRAIRGSNMLRDLPDIHIAPTSLSKASLADSMLDATRTIVRPGDLKPVTTYNSLFVAAEEFGNFLTVYEGEFMSALNSMYDGSIYEERKRHMKKGEAFRIDNPQLNILAGTTPGWLGTNLPQYAWTEGFASRLMMVFSSERIIVDPWEEGENDFALEAALKADLLDIHNMFGIMRFEDGVVQLYKEWLFGGQRPVPDHPKLLHYSTRRPSHLFKICMVISAQRSSGRIITVEDFKRSMDFMLEIESAMPKIFTEMQTSSDIDVIDETYSYIENLYIKSQAPVAEFKIVHFLMKRAPAREVKNLIDVMYKSNMINIVSAVGPGGRPTYSPIPKKLWNV